MIVTFYSFKGGVGRSMALANAGVLLAEQGLRVVLCDWDLEAPGLEAYVLDGTDKAGEAACWRGIVDLLREYREAMSVGLPPPSAPDDSFVDLGNGTFLRRPSSLLQDLPIRSGAGSLRLLPAGQRDGDAARRYADFVQGFDWRDFYARWAGGSYLEFFRKDLEDQADIVLIDSRTGLTEQGGVCTHHLADVVVLLSGANDLNVEGTLWMARALQSPNLIKEREARPLTLLPVAARIERTSEKEYVAPFRADFANRFRHFLPPDIRDPEAYFRDTEIPYVPFYSFKERVAARERPEQRSREMYEAYAALTKVITRLYRRTTQQAASVFLAYASADATFAKELRHHLTPLVRSGRMILWDDRDIEAGSDGAATIRTQLETADIVIALLSADFVASDFCFGAEFGRALARWRQGETSFLPVMVRATFTKGLPFAELQLLPRNCKPISEWDRRDAAWAEVAGEVERTLLRFRAGTPAAAARHNLPERNPHFIGRADLLGTLNEALTPGLTSRKAVLFGLGGIGKTQAALEYAWQHLSNYTMVWWLRAERLDTLLSDLGNLADVATGSDAGEHSAERRADRALAWLAENPRWLLIYDGAEDEAEIGRWLPKGNGAVIITSRLASWSRIRGIEVETLAKSDAVALLIERSGDNDAPRAEEVARELGHLPLALEQAGAFCVERSWTLDRYLKRLQTDQGDMLRRGTPLDYPVTLAAAWEMTFRQLEKDSPAAAMLLTLCCFLAPDDIPLDELHIGAQILPEPLASAMADDLRTGDVVAVLLRCSLVRARDQAISIHRLVQAIRRDRLSEAEHREWAGRAATLLQAAFRFDVDDLATWAPAERLLPHAETAAEWAEAMGIAGEATADLLDGAARCLTNRGLFGHALSLSQRAVSIAEWALPADSPHLVTYLNNLGFILSRMENRAEALPLAERALAIAEAASPPPPEVIAACCMNLGNLHLALQQPEQALPLHQRALDLYQSASPLNVPDVTYALGNLASTLEALGDYDQARHMKEHALYNAEVAFGPDHPLVGLQSLNLAKTLAIVGDWNQVQLLANRGRTIFSHHFGEAHPYTTMASELLLNATGVGQTPEPA